MIDLFSISKLEIILSSLCAFTSLLIFILFKVYALSNKTARGYAKLEARIREFEFRYNTTQKQVVSHLLFASPSLLRNIDFAGDCITRANNLLVLAESCKNSGNFRELDRILAQRFMPGICLGKRFDGTQILLPTSTHWAIQLDKLLIAIEKEVKGIYFQKGLQITPLYA